MVRSNAPAYELRNGPIIHGYQFIDSSLRKLPTSYYGRQSAVGLALTNHPRRSNGRPEDRALNVGVVGLGIGTVAAYGASGDHFRFYEINPEVARLANSDYFSYLKDTPARVEVVIGDARLSLERELLNGHPQEFDVFVLDAFSGDAIPVHLLTREAFKIYLRHLRPSEGLIAVHISNRFLDLRPVLWKIAQEFSLRAAFFHAAPEEGVAGESEWVILAPNGALLDRPAFAKAAERQQFDGTSFPFWTDDYSNLFRILR